MSVSLEEQLLEAVDQRDHELVKKLLGQGARVNEARDANGMTCLLLASSHFCLETELLQLEQFDPKDERTPDIEMVKLLLEAGADVTATDSLNESCLHHAAKVDQTGELTKILLDAGAKSIVNNNQDQWGCSPLGLAAQQDGQLFNRKRIVQMLIDAGAEFPPRCYVELRLWKNDDEEILRILLTASGAGAAISDRESSSQLFHEVVRHCHIDILKQMVDLGANVNSLGHGPVYEDCDQYTPLQIAVNLKCWDKIILLLEHGADPDAVNRRGRSAFAFAARKFTPCRLHKDILRTLLQHRKDGPDGFAALDQILQNGSIDCFKFYLHLVKQGVIQQINEPLLYSASMNGYHPILHYLLDQGFCQINEKYDDGLFAIHKLVESHRTARFGVHYYDDAIIRLTKIIALFESKKQPVDPTIHSAIEGFRQSQIIYEECKTELDRLQSLPIDGPTTYHSILVKDGFDTWITNERLMIALEFLHGTSQSLSNIFPTYHKLLSSNICEAVEMKRRRDLIVKAAQVLQRIIKIDSDIFSSLYDKIFYYLSNEDLSNLSEIATIA